jgi:UDP-MurNAc hydroxylase
MLEIDRDHFEVRWPVSAEQALEPFTAKERYLRDYAARMRDRIAAKSAAGLPQGVDVLAELKAWFEPLLKLADHIRADVGGPVLLRVGDDLPVVIDFPAAEVRPYAGEACRYELTVDRALIADHQTDWVNSLFLSMWFRARRIGPRAYYPFGTRGRQSQTSYSERHIGGSGRVLPGLLHHSP